MKKFFEKIKDIRNIVKFISFLSDALSTFVETYYKHYPEKENKIGTEKNKEE